MLTKLKKLVIHRKVFITVLLYEMFYGCIRCLRALFGIFGLVPFRVPVYFDILGVVSGVLLPILMFVTLYRLGKDIDLRSSYGSVGASILIAGALGPSLRCFLDQLISPELWWDSWAGQLYLTALQVLVHVPRQFFLGFTALALAYLRNREGPAEGVR